MKIVADDKIPFLKGVLEPFADMEYLPGQLISADHLKDADAMLIRTRTHCNEILLKDSGVKFIGTATIGYDHIDTAWCKQHGITWKNAPGCNASSVNQYMASTLVNLATRYGSLENRTLGVVGVGNVGSKVVNLAELFGMRVYLSDPPRVRKEGVCGFISLDGIIRECDIITFHVPLNYDGEDKTFRMISHDLLDRVNRGTLIINTSRGEVADGNALKKALHSGKIAGLILDVWEDEPNIDVELMQMCTIATPHIAGYSTDGKAKGTEMIIHELSRHFNLGIDDWQADGIPEPLNPEIRIDCERLTNEEVIYSAILHTYNVTEDDHRLREAPEHFDRLRGEYPLRREFKAFTLNLINADSTLRGKCQKIGFKIGKLIK
jgi:erythronate-4-phosphate dehydrogenase